MKKLWLALAFALVALPVAASADDSSAPPAPPAPPAAGAAGVPGRPAMTPAQRQAMFKAFNDFRTKETVLHKQLRTQIIGALSPAHRSAVAQAIGEMAVSASPDEDATAKRIDAILSSSERQAILSANTSFYDQSRALMQQMRSQVASVMPSPPAGAPHRFVAAVKGVNRMTTDPGTLVLSVLSRPDPMHVMFHGFGMRGAPGGPPDAAAPPPGDGAPPPAW